MLIVSSVDKIWLQVTSSDFTWLQVTSNQWSPLFPLAALWLSLKENDDSYSGRFRNVISTDGCGFRESAWDWAGYSITYVQTFWPEFIHTCTNPGFICSWKWAKILTFLCFPFFGNPGYFLKEPDSCKLYSFLHKNEWSWPNLERICTGSDKISLLVRSLSSTSLLSSVFFSKGGLILFQVWIIRVTLKHLCLRKYTSPREIKWAVFCLRLILTQFCCCEILMIRDLPLWNDPRINMQNPSANRTLAWGVTTDLSFR
jgi:hypothetical protein